MEKSRLQLAVEKLEAASEALQTLYKVEKEEQHRHETKYGQTVWKALDAVRLAALEAREVMGTPDVQRIPLEQEESKASYHKGYTERHESYGVISLARTTGRIRLAGSMLDSAPNCITFRVARARRIVNSDTHTEHWFHDGEIVEFHMSVYQFAEAITSLNGIEVPITLRSIQRVQMDPVPEEVKTPLETIAKNARNEFFKDQEDEAYFGAIDEVSEKIKAAGLSGKKTTELLGAVSKLKDFVISPKAAATWAARRFAEDTEASIQHAKIELAASISNMIHQAGLGALAGQLAEGSSLIRQLAGKKEDK